ncbi:MAG: hypothetical protein M1834_001762 [Cirrosporium novae-zelandiae]|nr:MAG: hypothetical protein M1834_001762 [Cirrosporium novae-zelandiae]
MPLNKPIEVTEKLGNLKIFEDKTHKPSTSKRSPSPPERWDDEEESDSGPEATESLTVQKIPNPPPPTPVSPDSSATSPREQREEFISPYSPKSYGREGPRSSGRPDKQTAVAGRLIAGALGLKAPRRTEEQRAFDKAMKEKEMKRRAQSREEEEKAKQEEEKAKQSFWDD